MAANTNKDQCASIGAAILYWNEVEQIIDLFLCKCLQIPRFMWERFMTSFGGGIEQKTDLILMRLAHDIGADHAVYTPMTHLLGRVKGMKKYRDHLAHTSPTFELNIGSTKQHRKIKTISLKPDELLSIAENMNVLVEDMLLAEDVFMILYGDTLSEDFAPNWLACGDPNAPQPQQGLQEYLAMVQLLNSKRSLPPLPGLPS